MGLRTTVLVIHADAGTGLFAWAQSLGLAPLRTLPGPGTLPAGADLVVVDLACSATGFDAHPGLGLGVGRGGTGRRVLVTGPQPTPGGPSDAPYRFFLSPRECLRQLALGPAALAAHYAEHPQDYLVDCGEEPRDFENQLRPLLGRDTASRLPALWREALRVLAQPGRVRDLGDLTLVLVPESLDPTLALAAARCLLRAGHPWWEAGQGLPTRPVLLLLLAGEAAPWEAPGQDPRAAVRGARLFAQDPAAVAGLAGWGPASHPLYYAHAWDYAVLPRVGDPAAHLRALDHDLCALLGRLLVDHRPLRHYGCTFFFAFDPGEAARDAFAEALRRHGGAPRGYQGDRADADDTQAMLYFLPHLRGLLYDLEAAAPGLEPVREWSLTGTAGWRLELAADPDGPPLSAAAVASVRLLRYFNGSYLLALRVTLPAPTAGLAALGGDAPGWWHPLAFAEADTLAAACGRALTRWLGFTRLARVVYPSFLEQLEEEKIARVVRLVRGGGAPPLCFAPRQAAAGSLLLASTPGLLLSPVLRHLLACFFGPMAGAQSLDQFLNEYQGFYDDRLFVNVAYGLAGPAPEPASRAAVMGRLFSLALLVDRPADTFTDCGGHAYDRTWLSGALADASLKVWEETGLYAGFTDLSNAWLGAGGYFCETVAPRHVPHGYERMLILSLFYLASLRRYHRQVSAATQALVRAGPPADDRGLAFRALREEFILFTNRYWFHEVTPQLQGRRIFALQQQALGLEAEYQLIKDELERAHEFLEADHDHAIRALSAKLSTVGQKVGALALGITLTALWVAILPLVPRDGDLGPLASALAIGKGGVLRELVLLLWAILPPALLSWGLWKWLFAGADPGSDPAAQGPGADSRRRRR